MTLPAAAPRQRSSRWIALAWALAVGGLVFLTPESRACRYNVRDVGFVDLDNEPFRLYCFIRHDTPPDHRAFLQHHAGPRLDNANIHFEIVDTDSQTNHPALIHHPATHTGPEPIAVLLSPDQQELRWPLHTPGMDFASSASLALSNLVSSPFRSTLAESAARAFGVVLLLEGTNPDSNARARRHILEGIAQIQPQMRLLPKPIEHPPELLVLDPTTQARESLLLWSLRLEPRPSPFARAVVIYGKTRWIGPLMADAEITPRNLTGLFSFIGADCECGLDLAWTQGTRLPIAWPETLRTALVRSLGFDPENPLTKTEVAAILGKRGSALVRGQPVSGPAAPLSITPSTPDTPAPVPPPVPSLASSSNASPDTTTTPDRNTTSAPMEPPRSTHRPFLALLGLALAVISVGLVLLWRTRQLG